MAFNKINDTVSYSSLLKETLPGLVEIGLPASESRVYLALSVEPNIPASRLCEITGIPDSKIYSILESAIRMNIVEVQYGVPKIYRAASPTALVSRMKENLKAHFNEELLKCDLIEASLNEVKSIADREHHDEESMELAYVIKGESNILAKMKEMIVSARESITLILPQLRLFNSLRELLLEAKLRGVGIRIAMTAADYTKIDEKRSRLFDMAVLTPSCGETWLALVDGRLLNVSRSSMDSSVSAILTRDKVLVQMADSYFENPSCCTRSL